MSLTSVGRNAVTERHLGVTTTGLTPEQKKQLEDASKGLLDTLTPWIPGDFVVSYGALLTAWASLRGSFWWLVIVASASSIVFVFGGAFAATGFKKAKDRAWKKLAILSIAGVLVSIYAAAAIPKSGWYDFKWFANNELSWTVTAGIVVVAIVFVLKGVQKRTGLHLG